MKLTELCPQPLPENLDLPEEVFIGHGVAERLPALIQNHCGPGPVLVVSDPNTRKACAGILGELKRRNGGIYEYCFESPPHAEPETVVEVHEEGSRWNVDGMLAIGSGSINDIVKCASQRLGIPYVVLGTAASMNGYASTVVALMEDGIKTTSTARPPRAVVLDTDILLSAPPEMAQAGLGDLISKPVSMADWWLADHLEKTGFSRLPGEIVSEAVAQTSDHASGLKSGDPKAMEVLARAIVLSGVSMVVAGSSAPASGGEHLISHLWDMEADLAGREVRLHGAQVGVATLLTVTLYHEILNLESPGFTDPPDWELEKKRIEKDFGPLSAAVLEQARRKHHRAGERLETLRNSWTEIRKALTEQEIPDVSSLRNVLQAAGAPRRLSDLGFTREDACRALRIAKDIRNRLTVLDLAFDLRVFPERIEEIVEKAGV